MASLKQQIFDVHTHNVNPDLREIYLHSVYNTADDEGLEPGVEYRQATTFIKNLHVLDRPPFDPILIFIHSVGGCWEDGMAIYNSVEFCKSPVKMVGYAQVSSMSGIIFQAAPVRIMTPDCHFMMHYGLSNGAILHPFALKNMAQMESRYCERMLQVFAKRAISGAFFKKRKSSTLKSVMSFIDKKLKKEVDWYLDAEESVFYGFADGILGSKEHPNLDSLRLRKEPQHEEQGIRPQP